MTKPGIFLVANYETAQPAEMAFDNTPYHTPDPLQTELIMRTVLTASLLVLACCSTAPPLTVALIAAAAGVARPLRV